MFNSEEFKKANEIYRLKSSIQLLTEIKHEIDTDKSPKKIKYRRKFFYLYKYKYQDIDYEVNININVVLDILFLLNYKIKKPNNIQEKFYNIIRQSPSYSYFHSSTLHNRIYLNFEKLLSENEFNILNSFIQLYIIHNNIIHNNLYIYSKNTIHLIIEI